MEYRNINDLDKTYELIMCDPPWKQSRGGKKSARPNSSGKSLDYPTLTLEEIIEHMRIATEHTAENAVLFLWTIDKYLFEAQEMAEKLGYKLHARMIWDKVIGIPAAFTVRFGHEYLLYMYKGKLIPVAKEERGKIHDVFHEQPTRHSKKPEVAYRIVERLYPDLTKLEMYSRYPRAGWDAFGNEI